MKPLADGLLDEIVRRLVDEFAPERIILFGSHAWGTPDDDSDVDLMVIVPESTEPGVRRAQRGHRRLRGLPISKDIIVKTREEFDRFARLEASLSHKILERGRTLYGPGAGQPDAGLAPKGLP